MAQLAVSVAGAAIGFAIGGPTGAQVGWAAGSMLSAAMGPGMQGPRLSDTGIQISSYGAAIGIVWGGVRKAGNVFWSTPLQEHTAEAGGKGGPTVTTYSYSVSCAVGICEGVQGGVRRIWADAKLVYDARDDAEDAAKVASASFRKYFEFYPGDETQMPDPTIESKEGAGNVPAYRGTCYVVFTDLPLGDFGNRIPVFSFELSDAAEIPSGLEYIAGPRLNMWADEGGMPYHLDGITEYTVLGTDGVATLVTTDRDAAIGELASRDGLRTAYIGYYTSAVEILSNYGSNGLNDGNGATYAFLCFNVEQPDHVVWNGLHVGGAYACYPMSLAGVPDPGVAGEGDSWLISSVEDPLAANIVSGRAGLVRLVPYGSAVPGYDEIVNNCTNYPPPPGGTFYPQAVHSRHAVIRAKRISAIPVKRCFPGFPTATTPAELPSDEDICVFVDGSIGPNVEYAVQAGAFLALRAGSDDAGGTVQRLPLGPVIRASDPRATDAAFWNAAAAAAGLADRYDPPNLPQPISEAGVGLAGLSSVARGSVALATIVTDVCRQAGLSDDQIDTSRLEAEVVGYQVARLTSARSMLEPLRQAFRFDAVESGGRIKFVPRTGSPVAHLTFDDLGTAEDGQPEEPIDALRSAESELPATVALSYSAVSADYQTGVQVARRMTSTSALEVTVEAPVVMTDSQAADVAAVLLAEAWVKRTERRLTLTRAWAHLEPTDVITLNDGEFDVAVRIQEIVEDGPVLRVTAVDHDAAAYLAKTPAVPTPGGGSTVTVVIPALPVFLDVPLLREQDDAPGFYFAATGYGPSWPGGHLFRLEGGTYKPVRDIDREATTGRALSVLPPYTGGNTVDILSSVLVRLNRGTLSSTTRAGLLGFDNHAMLGNELIQFQHAELISAGVYRLSRLLRGRRGTEQHMGAHLLDEVFVLLDEQTAYRVRDNVESRDVPLEYRLITSGRTITEAAPTAFTNSQAALKPLSPSHLRAGRRADGVYIAAWIRRTRSTAPWQPGIDVPLKERLERYRVIVLDGGTVLQQITVTTPAAVLDAFDGDPPDYTGMTLTVQQVSDLVGPGFPASITL